MCMPAVRFYYFNNYYLKIYHSYLLYYKEINKDIEHNYGVGTLMCIKLVTAPKNVYSFRILTFY